MYVEGVINKTALLQKKSSRSARLYIPLDAEIVYLLFVMIMGFAFAPIHDEIYCSTAEPTEGLGVVA